MEPGDRTGRFSSLHVLSFPKSLKFTILKGLSLGMFIRISEWKGMKGLGAAKTRIEWLFSSSERATTKRLRQRQS